VLKNVHKKSRKIPLKKIIINNSYVKGASIRTRNDGSMVLRSLETLGSNDNTLGKAVGLTGAFRGHILGLGAAAAAAAVVATATAVFSWPPAAAAAVSLSAGGRLLVVSFLTGVVLGVGCSSGLQQGNKFYSICMPFFAEHRKCCGSGSKRIRIRIQSGSRILMTKDLKIYS
jgi:hypothetical protein